MDKQIEILCEKICEGYCKYPFICKTQDEMEGICDKCPLGDLEKMLEEK